MEHAAGNGDARQKAIDWRTALDEHDRWLRCVVRGRLGEPQAVDDVMQEVALAALAQHSPLADPAKVAPWLYRTAVRQSLMYRRRAGRQRRLTDRVAQQQSDDAGRSTERPLDWLMLRERDTAVRAALAALSDLDREVLVLKHSEGWTYQQVAEHLGVSRHAVEYRLLKARDRLRRELTARNVMETDE